MSKGWNRMPDYVCFTLAAIISYFATSAAIDSENAILFGILFAVILFFGLRTLGRFVVHRFKYPIVSETTPRNMLVVGDKIEFKNRRRKYYYKGFSYKEGLHYIQPVGYVSDMTITSRELYCDMIAIFDSYGLKWEKAMLGVKVKYKSDDEPPIDTEDVIKREGFSLLRFCHTYERWAYELKHKCEKELKDVYGDDIDYKLRYMWEEDYYEDPATGVVMMWYLWAECFNNEISCTLYQAILEDNAHK